MLVGIAQAERGKACACVCPECNAPLLARQGEERAWHFAHAASNPDCKHAAETALHRMAKQLIANWQSLDLPSLKVTETLEGLFQRHEATAELPQRTTDVVCGEAEVDLRTYRPDVLLTDHLGGAIAIEVFVSHAVCREKGERVRASGMPMLEFDLRDLPRIGLTEEDLDRRLRATTPRWIHHPGEESLRARLARQLRDQEAQDVAERAARFAQRHSPVEPPSPPQSKHIAGHLIKMLWLGDVELRIKKHPLCEAIVIWAAESNDAQRVAALLRVAEVLHRQQISCNPRSRRHGYLVAWGETATDWARSVSEKDLGG